MSKVVNLKGLMETEGGLSRSLSLAEDAAQTLRSMILLEKLPPARARIIGSARHQPHPAARSDPPARQ